MNYLREPFNRALGESETVGITANFWIARQSGRIMPSATGGFRASSMSARHQWDREFSDLGSGHPPQHRLALSMRSWLPGAPGNFLDCRD
jgi:hypothetical protein